MLFELRDRLIEGVKRKGVYRSALCEARAETGMAPGIIYLQETDTVSKNDLRERYAHTRIRFGWRRATTSGTSGSPFLFPQPLAALQREQAFVDSLWFLEGFSVGARVAVLRGALVPRGIRRAGSRLLISCDGWTDADILRKHRELIKFSPRFVHCYPSLLERFLRRCCALNLPMPDEVTAVLSGSEECTADQEALFSSLLGCRTVAWYGQSEQVALAVKERDGSYAVVPNYSDVAFIKRDNGLEIVGRSRSNPFFSGFWYRTGDFCESAEVARSRLLGRRTIVLHGLQGRSTKQVVLSDGSTMPFNHVIFGLHSQAWASVDRYCFIQKSPGTLVFAYSLAPGVRTSVTEVLLTELQARFPKGLMLESRRLDELSGLTNVKWKYFFESESAFSEALNATE